MRIEEDIQIVKDFVAAMGSTNRQYLLAMVNEDFEWIIPGEDWPLAGTHRGHAGLAEVLQTASEALETSFPKPPEYVGRRETGFWSSAPPPGKSKPRMSRSGTIGSSTSTVRNGKVTRIQEYINTQALARAAQMDV